MRDTIVRVPIVRTVVFWGLHWGPPISGKLPFGWLSKLWSLFGTPIIIRHLIFRVPKKGP